MEGMIRRLKVNALLFVGLFVTLIVCATVDVSNEPNKYELPKLQTSRPEKIVHHSGYSVSFNTDRKIPNWVAYELTAEEVTGTEPRGNNFVPDPQIWQSPSTDDYKNSGYDRGHMLRQPL